MSATTEPFSDPTVPHPPRFWWLKRISIAVALMLIGLVIVRWQWERVAEARGRALVDAAHARGEPILPEDFAPEAIPDADNAAVTLRRAADAMVSDANSDWMDKNWSGGMLAPAEVARVDVIAANNALPLELVRRARSQPNANWRMRFRRPVVETSLSHLNPQRELANLQQQVALRDHAKGEDAASLERVRDLLRQADAIEQGPEVVTTHLAALGFLGLTTHLIGQIAPDLGVAANAAASDGRGAARRDQVRAVIDHLVDERSFRAAAVRSWQGERMMMLDSAAYVAEGPGSEDSRIETWLIRPTFLLDGVRLAEDRSRVERAAGLASWPQAVAALPAYPETDLSEFGRIAHRLGHAFSITTNQIVRVHFQILTERRAAAIELALRLYRMDHGDRLPPTLSGLVPDYLPALPADPMAADGRAFAYHPDAKPPVIYSVGENGIDNGGASLPDEVANRYRWNLPDAVFAIEPVLPGTQPASTETQDNQ